MKSSNLSHGSGHSRREFLQTTALGCLALTLPTGCSTAPTPDRTRPQSFEKLSRELLRDWCDGMLAVQINDPANPAEHGALGCPACGIIHGRCMDAVYPLLHQAKVSGDRKYLAAGIAVFEWSKNVSQPDGSWTVVADPKSWKGITVFGAIALADALHHHGDLLDAATRTRWMERLGRAADYLYANFTTMDFSNVNYGCTGIYAMHLLGGFLNRPKYFERSRELAAQVKNYLTTPNGLLFGEGKPADGRSPRSCQPVDLGYNVEESLVALSLYADATKDAEFTRLIVRAWQAHLEFMLPDGAWDNSWGTRSFKWTYWGSRTCDGCQPGLAALAEHDPAFATAAYENTQLFARCTSGGLLHGGLHYASHGVKPCVHHTFTHAKALATMLDNPVLTRRIKPGAPLPRAQARGVREYPEIATWLAAQGSWRATITAYDWVYKKGIYHPTGGALAMLWHTEAGPLLAGSMATYNATAERNNMQPLPPGGDHPLTPRVELRAGKKWFTNLHDMQAQVTHAKVDGAIEFQVETQLLSEAQETPPDGAAKCRLTYRFTDDAVSIAAHAICVGGQKILPKLVLPIVSRGDETYRQLSDRSIEITKPGCKVVVESNAPLTVDGGVSGRVFNLVPGFEALSLSAETPVEEKQSLVFRISVLRL